MQFLKKHYEKAILSVVLLGLAATAVWLFMTIDQKKTDLDIKVNPPTKPKKVAPVDLAPYEKAVERFKNATPVDFSVPHHVFNSVVWKQRGDGTLFKIAKEDMASLVKTLPLHLIISFDRVAGTGYYFGVTREAAFQPADRKKVARYLTEGGKSDLFSLKGVIGPAENPTAFTLVLNDNKQEVVVTPDQPFKRMEGRAADLKYEVDNKTFNNVRVGGSISFAGETYKVIAITENAVTVQANSNQKQTTIRLKSAQ